MHSLNDFIRDLVDLQRVGFGDATVCVRDSRSGACDPITGVRDDTDTSAGQGPWDLLPGEAYIVVSIG
jgi:hypothetical protein